MTPAPASDPVRDELHTFYDDSFAALLSTSPEVASEIGVDRIGRHRIPQDAFSDISGAGEARRQTLIADTLKRLEALTATSTRFPREDLNRQIYEFFLRWGHFGRLRGTEGHGFDLCDSIADHLCGVDLLPDLVADSREERCLARRGRGCRRSGSRGSDCGR